MKKSNRKTWFRLGLTVLGVLLIVSGAYLLFRALGWTDVSRAGLQAFIESKGVIAPIIFIAISFLQVTFVPIPGAVTVFAGCYVFGIWRSFLYSYIGMLAGAMLAFWLGRAVGRRYVSWLLGSQEQTEAWLVRFRERGNVLLFFMFLFPGFPDDLLCSVAGILPITWGGFFVMQAITRVTSIGATVLFLSGDIIPFRGWGLAVLGAAAVIGAVAFLLCFKNAAKINDYCVSLLHRISKMKAFDFMERMKLKKHCNSASPLQEKTNEEQEKKAKK